MTKLNAGGNYLKASDVKRGDKVKFLSEGEWEESTKFTYDDGNPVKSYVMDVDYQGKEMKLKINKSSRVNLIEAWGDETKDWIGKEATILVLPSSNGQHKMIVLEPVTQKEQW